MTDRTRLRKEKLPSYGLKSILIGTLIDLAVAYFIHNYAVETGAKQPLQGTIIAASLLWIVFTVGTFVLLIMMGNIR